MKNDRRRKSGSDGFVAEIPITEGREVQLIQTQGLVAVWIRIRLNELGKGQQYRQFKVLAGTVGKHPTLLINAPAWAKKLKLETHLRGECRRLRPAILNGWALQFDYSGGETSAALSNIEERMVKIARMILREPATDEADED